MPSITSAAAGKWSSQRSGVLVNLCYIIELLLFDENGVKRSCTAVILLCVACGSTVSSAARGYNIFVQCFLNDNFMIGL